MKVLRRSRGRWAERTIKPPEIYKTRCCRASNSPSPRCSRPPKPEQKARCEKTFQRSGDLLDLPVFQVHGRAPAQKADHGHELVAFAAPDHGSLDARERARGDAHPGSDRNGLLGCHRQARAEHRVDLSEIPLQRILVENLENAHQPVSTQSGKAGIVVAMKKQVAREQGKHRANLAAAGRTVFLQHLGQIEREPLLTQFPSHRLLLPGLGVQAPPDGVDALRAIDLGTIPEVRRIKVGLGG